MVPIPGLWNPPLEGGFDACCGAAPGLLKPPFERAADCAGADAEAVGGFVNPPLVAGLAAGAGEDENVFLPQPEPPPEGGLKLEPVVRLVPL